MPCQTVTVSAGGDGGGTPSISIESFNVSKGQNVATISYTAVNSGDASGSVTVETYVDIGNTGSKDASKQNSHSVSAGGNANNSVTFEFDFTDDRQVKCCAEVR